MQSYADRWKNEKARGLTFGEALEIIKQGHKCARRGWNGGDMWIAYSPGSQLVDPLRFWSPASRAYAFSEQQKWARGQADGGGADFYAPWPGVEVLPCIMMKTADGKILMGWLASQTDMLAEDWFVVEP